MQAAASKPSAMSPSAATLLSTTHPYLHPKPRIGQTSTTKLYYEPTEQHFAPNDMQPQARAAREQVHAMLHATPFSADPPWNASTLPSPTPLEQSSHFDDKHYAALHTAHLVHRAHTRLATIRAHQDPDADPRHIQPRWNVSSKLEDDEGHTVDMDVLKGLGGKREVALKDYVGPLEAEVRFEEELRQGRRERQEEARKEQQRRIEAAEWERKEQWQADVTPIATLPSDAYRTAAPIFNAAPLSPASSATTLAQYLHSTAPLPLAASSAHAPASRVRMEPLAVYCHPGHYAWVSPTLRQWSCCHSPVHSLRGCVRVGDAKDRVRLLRAGSEDGRGRVVRLLHGGRWDDARDGGMWSCCGSGERNGRGCQTKTLVREDRWNLE